jgi:hypothetical protein
MIFVSACHSATAGAVADPLALTLVRVGVPAVLGWEGSVHDQEATMFAHPLYRALAREWALEEACAAARRTLLTRSGPSPSHDWHLTRLWLGRRGGGPLVGGRHRRHLLAKDHGHQAFLDVRHQRSPVASRAAFVSRRRELQTDLRVLREGRQARLLLHGLGRLGKSSLAARLAHRRVDLEPVVIFGHANELHRYEVWSVAGEIGVACPTTQPQIDAQRHALRERPEALEGLLRELLEGLCQQGGVGTPILLVIDDLERILEEPETGGPWRVKPAQGPMLQAVLRAFSRARTDSRLMLTSRYTFTLPDADGDLAQRLYALPLPPMDQAGARKQAWRREQSAAPPTAAPDAGEESAVEARRALFQRGIDLAQGHPGLQDLLFDLALGSPEAAPQTFDEMAAYRARGAPPEAPSLHRFLEDLALGKLLVLAGPAGRELLRAATLFEQPVPEAVWQRLARSVGGPLEALLALGLCDRFEDLVVPMRAAVAVNALVLPQVGTLHEREVPALAAEVLPTLFTQWGGADGSRRPYLAKVELTRLALHCKDAEVLTVCAAEALDGLHQQFAYREAAAWGQ